MTVPGNRHAAAGAGAIASAWGVRGIPVHYFIDAKGTIKATHVGILPPDRIKEYLTQIGG